MKSVRNFRNSKDELYFSESKKNKKPNYGQKGNSQKKRFIEELDDEDDMDFNYKERESIEDYFDDDEDEF
ncbi:MAG: hypothetical protein LBP85_09635 [Prevotellaceae bacterium]|jgi:hypothetical protein|nr:hypothetical protein [Prevotellaceae bacterium]